MRLVRPALALALVGSLAGAGFSVSQAAVKVTPVCNLLSDDPNDSGLIGPDADSKQEITGGDIASDAKTVTAVLRLKAAPAIDPISPGGLEYYVSFTVPGAENPVYLGASMDPTGAMSYGAGDISSDGTSTNYSNSDVPVRGKIDGTNLVITANLSDFASLATIKKGAKITGLTAETFGVVNTPVEGALLPFGSDTADGGKDYVAGTPSCVAPVA